VSDVGRKWQTIFSTSIRYALAAVFIVSAIGKLSSPAQFYAFASSLNLPGVFNPQLLIYTLIGFELAVSILLMYPTTVKLGGILSFGVVFLFTTILMYVSQTGEDVACGCFGDIIKESSADISILRNFILLLLSGLVVYRSNYETHHRTQE